MAGTGITQMRRSVKNVAYNYSDAQVKVREATSNDPWGPSSTLMAEVADLTYNSMAFTEIMSMIWKRLNDSGKNWRHVYKALVLLDYMIKTGSEKVAHQCKENIFAIQTLKDFQHIEDNKDQGMNVREKAKQLVALLKDEERLKNERARALMAKKRFAQNSTAISSDGTTQYMSKRDTHNDDLDDFENGTATRRKRRDSELEGARPTSSGEEELQLQIALALSKEEAQREEELKRGDDIRLQMAITESRSNPVSQQNSVSNNAIDDLLELQGAVGPDPWLAAGGAAATGAATAANDPWGGADDPWAAKSSATVSPPRNRAPDPWPTPIPPPNPTPASTTSVHDPWAPLSPPRTATPPTQTVDPFSPLPLNNTTNQNSNADPWGTMDILGDALHNGGGDSPQNLLNGRSSVKTPENFLGENSALVNLENLMGPSNSVVPKAAPPATNPFLGVTGSGGTGNVTPTNPFLAQQRPSPTLNQMRQQGGQPAADAGAAWASDLPAPLQPAKPANNPFMA